MGGLSKSLDTIALILKTPPDAVAQPRREALVEFRPGEPMYRAALERPSMNPTA